MTDADSGLPADSLSTPTGRRSVQTSTTNIGAYMWSTVVAERLGHHQPRARPSPGSATTLDSLETMERHQPSGQFYNWYDHRTGAKLTAWPPTGEPLTPDPVVGRQRLAGGGPAGRRATRVPEVAARAGALFDSMDFGFYYRPAVNRDRLPRRARHRRLAVLLRHDRQREPDRELHRDRQGRAPGEGVLRRWRTFPDTCDWSWQETKPIGRRPAPTSASSVFEGAYPYDGMRVVPGWGGSMFEALMPALFVPEEKWGPRSWAVNHPLTVAAQIHHGLVEAGYGYWGFSPSNNPEGGYRRVRRRRARHEPARATPRTRTTRSSTTASPAAATAGEAGPAAVRVHERRRHAARRVPRPALGARARRWPNLAAAEADFAIYDQWGFRDSVNVDTGVVSDGYLSLDQGIVMASIGNALGRRRPAPRLRDQGGPQRPEADHRHGDVRSRSARGRRPLPAVAMTRPTSGRVDRRAAPISGGRIADRGDPAEQRWLTDRAARKWRNPGDPSRRGPRQPGAWQSGRGRDRERLPPPSIAGRGHRGAAPRTGVSQPIPRE